MLFFAQRLVLTFQVGETISEALALDLANILQILLQILTQYKPFPLLPSCLNGVGTRLKNPAREYKRKWFVGESRVDCREHAPKKNTFPFPLSWRATNLETSCSTHYFAANVSP